jgi:serine/threonine protein phosphatase 1
MNYIKFIDKNTVGRDFVVGDLHGCRSLLMHALEGVSFNPSVDRVFCTGDLIDRGPESFETLRLLEEPWFYTVAGNHEDLLLKLLDDSCEDWVIATFAANGGAWFFSLSDEDMFYLKDVLHEKLKNLPLVLRVESDAGVFQIAHAELCTETGDTLTDVMLEFSDLEDFQSSIQWGRTRIDWAFENLDLPSAAEPGFVSLSPGVDDGLTLTYVGHTIVPCPILFRSHLYIDGGASRTYVSKFGRLMLIEHGADCYTSAAAWDLDARHAA